MGKEVWLMRHLKHSHVIACIESFVVHHNLYIITPLSDYGSALNLIQSHFFNGFPEPVIAGILRDVLYALTYLHSKGYRHRSIRAYCIVYDYPSDPVRSFCW